jgi:hypothetical protein
MPDLPRAIIEAFTAEDLARLRERLGLEEKAVGYLTARLRRRSARRGLHRFASRLAASHGGFTVAQMSSPRACGRTSPSVGLHLDGGDRGVTARQGPPPWVAQTSNGGPSARTGRGPRGGEDGLCADDRFTFHPVLQRHRVTTRNPTWRPDGR